MRITHTAISSSVFELVKTVEVDVTLGEEMWPTRFEVLCDTERNNVFRCRVWQLEFFRIQSTFPQASGKPAHEPSDHRLIVAWDGCSGHYDDFVATDVEAALRTVIKDFYKFLEHTTGEKAI